MSELMFNKKFNRRVYVTAALLALAGAVGGAFGAYALWPSRLEIGYEPAQPIAFSHKTHAGALQIECRYCHSRVDRGPFATVPDVATCMKCHNQVQPTTADGQLNPEIEKLNRHWRDSEPIAWTKVYDLADFTYFDHSRHIAADLECKECHGDVPNMARIRRVSSLKMQWCLDCHKQELPENDPKRVQGRTTRGPIVCSTCHR